MSRVVIKNLNKCYEQGVKAVDNVSLELADGELFALLGSSGCGKTTVLRCIAGLERPDSGSITVDGIDISSLAVQERDCGMVFQNYALFPHLTVRENVAYGLAAGRYAKSGFLGRLGSLWNSLASSISSEDAARVEEMLKTAELSETADRLPAQLSGGQQQRVALARILLSGPELLMLDEPLSALDDSLRRQTELELTEIFDSFPGTVLLVSHSRGEARRLCRSVTVLDNGLGEGSLPVEQLFKAPRTLSQALAAGWENCSRIAKIDGSRVYAEDWGFELSLPEVPGDCAYIAVRARSLRLADAPGSNTVPVKIRRVIADLSCTALIASAAENVPSSGLLRLESVSGDLPAAGEEALWYFPAEELLLLKK